jgi:hypothetical protein
MLTAVATACNRRGDGVIVMTNADGGRDVVRRVTTRVLGWSPW